MTTSYMIVDRETGEPFGGKPKLYEKASTAKGVLTAEGFNAPKFRWAVVEVEVTITEIVPDQKLVEADFNLLVSSAEAELNRISNRDDEKSFNHFYGHKIEEVDRFHGAYGRLKYV